MKRRILITAITFLMLLLLFSGCVFVNRDFRQTRNAILDEIGDAEIDTKVQLQIGPGLLSIGKLVASLSNVDEEARVYLREVQQVQLGVYKLQLSHTARLRIPAQIATKLERRGYQPMIKIKQPDENVWIMTKMRGEQLHSLYVIALDQQELVLVEVKGRLNKIIEKAIQEHGFNNGNFIPT